MFCSLSGKVVYSTNPWQIREKEDARKKIYRGTEGGGGVLAASGNQSRAGLPGQD